ncbi:lymphocyte activation gene 3 protein [Mustelus asterias]
MLGNDGVVKHGLGGVSQRAHVKGRKVDTGEYSLEVRRVRLGDAGLYRCSVLHGDRTLEREVRLVVVQVTPDTRGHPFEGSELHLRCEVSEALQGARFSWHRGGESPGPGGERVRTGDEGRMLYIDRLEPEDRGVWECLVTFQSQKVRASYEIRVLGFVNSAQEVPTFYVRPGSQARLSLALTPELPCRPETCGWLRGRGGAGARSLGEDDGAWTERSPGALALTLAPTRASDRGLFTGYLNASGYWIARTVRLEFVEVTVSQAGPVLLGTSLRVNVSTAYPAGLDEVVWGQENRSAAGMVGEDFWEEGWGLYIPQVTPSHAGNWTCALYRDGVLVGNTSYLLEITALDYQASNAAPSTRRITLVVALTFLMLIIVAACLILLRKFQTRRQSFPALDVTLTTAEVPAKKV